MNNKLKSLVYLSCFIFASVVYHQTTNTEAKEELAANTLEQEVDIVINPYEEQDKVQTN
ncbi:hypothetical protein [Maribacter sp. LLG6340-A2]|uniref:hypothetical protein n=1 Tax=Maribacter sp. LLG6340-A2 TaxID=3160834 RepID=UPI00386F6DDF